MLRGKPRVSRTSSEIECSRQRTMQPRNWTLGNCHPKNLSRNKINRRNQDPQIRKVVRNTACSMGSGSTIVSRQTFPPHLATEFNRRLVQNSVRMCPESIGSWRPKFLELGFVSILMTLGVISKILEAIIHETAPRRTIYQPFGLIIH
jgi:hypothetical protein